MASENLIDNIKSLFTCGVNAVQPGNLFRTEHLLIDKNESKLICNFGKNPIIIDISNKRCHLVGFGKAVYGMAGELSKVLGNRLESGIISVPLNIHTNFPDIQLPTVVKVFEGAKNNLPDENATNAATQIVDFVKCLTKNDILFVLISGGGSALFPLPCQGISLDEKLNIIKKLASKGATISDINCVRIHLSQTKGGQLANYAKNAGQIITFIISDIIGDPIHLIASGPTVQFDKQNEACSINILNKFQLWDSLPEFIQNAIKENAKSQNDLPNVKNVQNIIIANNEIAVNAILREINKRNANGIILSTEIDGNVIDLSQAYFKLSKCIQAFKSKLINENQFIQNLEYLRHTLHIRYDFFQSIVSVVNESRAKQSDLCVIGGGEPTVTVDGDGVGGRNQELALRFSQFAIDDNLTQDVLFLSAGTDGIDGPTTAAGALGGADIIRNYLKMPGKRRNDIDTFIRNNDSFSFYSNLHLSKYHIVTGHTGTNVMDIHILYFPHKVHPY